MGFADALATLSEPSSPPSDVASMGPNGRPRVMIYGNQPKESTGSFGNALSILSGETAAPSAPPANPSIVDKLTGNGTERYQTWPERLVRGAISSAQDALALPHDVIQEAQQPKAEISDSDVSTLSAPRALNFGAIASTIMRPPGGQTIPIKPGNGPPPSAPVVPPQSEGQQVAQAGQRLGIDLPRAVTSDSMGTQWAGKIATNVPLAGTPLRRASENAITGLGEAATKTEGELGLGNIPTSGAAIRSGLTDYLKSTIPDRKEMLYNRVGQLVDAGKSLPLQETSKIADAILSRRDNAAIVQPSQAVKLISEAVGRPNGLNYEGVKTLRTYIGEMLNGGSPLPADMSQAELKQVYGALSTDLRSVAKHAGGDTALRAFDRANNYARLAAQRSEKLASVLGANSDEAIFDRLTAAAGSTSRANIDLLRTARKSVDAASWDEYVSGVVSRLGRDTEGNFSPDRFVTAFGKLTPEAKTVLFKSTSKPEIAIALEDIAKVSSRFKQLNKFANPSGTGQTVIGVGELQGLVTAPLTTLSSIVGGRILSHILSKPQTVVPAAAWVKAYEQAAAKPSMFSRAALQRAAKLLAVSVGKDVGRLDLAPKLASELNGAVPSAADQNKQ